MTRLLLRFALGVALAMTCMTSLAGCSTPNHPTVAGIEPVPPLALTCPSDVRVQGVKTASQTVTYSAPSHAGGVDPVSVACAAASGSSFPLGSTRVSCTASDSSSPARTAACSFTVTLDPFVAPVPTLQATKFMAYGDSITAGEINDDDLGTRCPEPSFLPDARLPSLAYPALVQQLLSARYTNQTFSVKNEGQGENATTDTGRFANAVRADRPEAVLFLQGVIDLADNRPVSAIIANIRTDILEAQRQGASTFFLSTLTPVLNFSRGCYTSNADVRALNDAIRALAVQENIPLVDTWATFAGREDTYLHGDGLHPTEAGQQAITRAFFDVIVSKLESASTSAATAASHRR